MTPDNGTGTPVGKPIVKLADVTKIYEMGHAGGGGLLNRRRGPSTTVTVHALRGVSVDFYPGEYIAIMGASGLRQEHDAQLAGMSRSTDWWLLLPGRPRRRRA